MAVNSRPQHAQGADGESERAEADGHAQGIGDDIVDVGRVPKYILLILIKLRHDEHRVIEKIEEAASQVRSQYDDNKGADRKPACASVEPHVRQEARRSAET